MTVSEKTIVLNRLDIGSVIAEQDELLTQCFVSHHALDELLNDRKDLILGSKGAGKSALWKEIKEKRGTYSQLDDTELVLATNHTGDPDFREVFKSISSTDFPNADQLRTAWKIYLLALFFKQIKERIEEDKELKSFEKELKSYNILYTQPHNLKKLLNFAIDKARSISKADIKVDEVEIGAEFKSHNSKNHTNELIIIPFNDLYKKLSEIASKYQFRVWIILDRLDEIVLGDEDKENIILKGLLLAYRDISDYKTLRAKIFLRDDVYLRVGDTGHFPALTHINSRATSPISWELNDLLELVVKRLLTNKDIAKLTSTKSNVQMNSVDREKVFYSLFPKKIDQGRAADGFKWICDRLSDGNGIVTPRDLLSVIEKAKSFQIRQNQRDNVELPESLLFTTDSIRKAVKSISNSNLETRIYPEYPDLKSKIKLFERGKADHNDLALEELLGQDWLYIAKRLERIGFLYKRRKSGVDIWTIPFFYSFALEITRGSNFKYK
ncbi:P-loop ATPase, Sll1717 family [Hymenobacter cheonanensis]|uniref:P-loop ATPase, Sll1717 family n=1 Tax=Hymenobacter sp. CA2-7 TaxID=3063993 RepID=UPI00271222B7|nr:hypothetical protein [Hymenobacter sp. CA2-7]MDO7883919.1 hypothetical protein [Hymenobacter sp. CA2-7]